VRTRPEVNENPPAKREQQIPAKVSAQLKYRRCDRQLIRNEIEKAKQKIEDGNLCESDGRTLQNEIEKVEVGTMKSCHGLQYNPENVTCGACAWRRSCFEFTPVEKR